MSSRAVKFVNRAPRYTLSPKDNRYLRFSKRNERGQSHTTRFIDISQSGLAFICDDESAPRISDLIKVEIPIGDNDERVAWWARVVRVEEYNPKNWHLKSADFQESHQVLVAVTFHEMPPLHARKIRHALDIKFTEMYNEQRHQYIRAIAQFLSSNIIKFILYGACIALTLWLLYWLSQPSETYDSKKGAPWGERFPNMPLKPGTLDR
jgi:hypothetical protein